MKQQIFVVFLFVMYHSLALASSPPNALGLQAPSVIRSDSEAELSSILSSTVQTMPFNEGSVFNKGDLLLAFDCAAQRVEVEVRAAEYNAEKAEYTGRAALHSRGGIGKTEVEVSKGRMAAAKARLRQAKVVADGCEIYAPFDGRIAEVAINQYEYVEPSQTLLSIVSTKGPRLEIIAPSSWLKWLKVGAEGTVSFDDVDSSFYIKIDSLGATVDPVSNTIKITAVFLGDVNDLLPGMSGLVRF